MSYCSLKPSLTLFPSVGDRKFSHAEVGQGHDYPYHVVTHRDIYTQGDIDTAMKQEDSEDGKESKCLYWLRPDTWCSMDILFNTLLALFPVISTTRGYELKEYFLGDLISGLSVACMHFPQGLAYGLLASLSPTQGLYSSFFPVLFYTIFGMSPHMSMGTDAVMAIITAEVVESEANAKFGGSGKSTLNETIVSQEDILQFKASIAAGCTLVAGCILVVMGILRLGFLTSFQSTSFIGGFTTAASFHIFTSQIPKAFGLTVPLVKGPGKLMFMYIAVIQNIQKANLISLALVFVSVVFLIFFKDYINIRYKHKLKMPVPADLLLIIIATAASAIYRCTSDYFPVEVVGEFSRGLPSPTVPNIDSLERIWLPSLQMAMISFFLTIAMAKLCAEKHEYEINDNQELMAYGLLNLSSSFFYCFPSCTSPPRSMLLSSMGAKTTLNGICTSFALLTILLFLGQLFVSLPIPVLAAMILVSVKPLLSQFGSLPRLFRINKYDFSIWLLTCTSGILIDLPYGLIVGIASSFIVIVIQSQQRKLVTTLFWDRKRRIFLEKGTIQNDPERYCCCRYQGEIKICLINTSFYFATADMIRKTIYKLTIDPINLLHSSKSHTWTPNTFSNSSTHYISSSTSPSQTSDKKNDVIIDSHTDEDTESVKVKVIIIVCNAVSYIDIQGVNTLSVMYEEYKRVGITVLLASCTKSMVDILKRSDFYDAVSPERVFYQIDDAYQAAVKLLH